MSLLKRHLSPGLVVGVIALCVALGGTAFALSTNSVGAKALKSVSVRTAGGSVTPGASASFTATCGSKEQILGGGVDIDTQTSAMVLEESHPQGNGWQGNVFNNFSSTAHTVTVQALCLKK